MVANLAQRPTHVIELVPGDNHYTGYCDVCAAGAGSVWISGNLDLRPLVRRVPFSVAITSQVISDTNPRGTLTNSDLEMAAVLLHNMVLEQEVGQSITSPHCRTPTAGPSSVSTLHPSRPLHYWLNCWQGQGYGRPCIRTF
jgi:hypothetical protein